MEDWQPIETAPKDGTRILILLPSGHIEINRWEKYETVRNGIVTYSREGFLGVFTLSISEKPNPTHWMPLPKGLT